MTSISLGRLIRRRLIPLHDGAKIIALQDAEGSIANPAGIDIPAALAHTAAHGSLCGFFGAEPVSEGDFWQLECEYFVPAALEGQVTPQRARAMRTRIVVEGANGPTLPAADDILRERDILVIPDVLANAGGVTVSYFEWVQDFSSFFWSEEEINIRLESIMTKAFEAVWRTALERQVSIRTAAFIIACQRVLAAREQRGLYP